MIRIMNDNNTDIEIQTPAADDSGIESTEAAHSAEENTVSEAVVTNTPEREAVSTPEAEPAESIPNEDVAQDIPESTVPPVAPGAPYSYPPYPFVNQPQKRKMPTGLKVLLITMCVLFGISLIGFTGYGVSNLVRNIIGITQPSTPQINGGFSIPWDDDNDSVEEDTVPEEDDTESSAEEFVRPDIDVVPNTDGLLLSEVPDTEELDITEVYDKVIQSTVLVLVSSPSGTGSGTGIIATEDGYIITNSHVVLNSRSVNVEVKMNDGTVHEAVVVGFDKTTDLAVLKIDGEGYTPAEFANSDTLRMGQWVIAIGNPGGEQFSGSITRGIISGLNRSVGSYSSNGMTYIQTDAAINPGNSGGPLVNLHGQVVGINSAKIVSDEYEGMGFAIPITGAKQIIDDLLSSGYVQGRVRFGIKGTEVTELQAYVSNVKPGFLISEIDEDSNFAGTEVQPSDIIIAVNGEETPTLEALSNALLAYMPGDTVTVTLMRPSDTGPGGEEFDVDVVLLADLGETQG